MRVRPPSDAVWGPDPAKEPGNRPGVLEADLISTHRTVLVFLAWSLCVGVAAGCTDSHLVTGVYRSNEPIVLDDIAGFGGDGVYVELVLGQFGPDVAGLVRFLQDPFTLIPAPGGCDCRIVQDGRYDNGEVLFSFRGPVPCDDTAALVGVRLQPDDTGDTLRGRLGTKLEGELPYTFTRKVSEQDLTDSHKHCEEKFVDPPKQAQ